MQRTEDTLYPRYVITQVEEALGDTPVVLIHGPRQCGKTTLARIVAEKHGHAYFTFDNENVLRSAREDPVGFVAKLPERVVLDEVQRVPELFSSLKASVDALRLPGRFILTGSTNVLLLPALSDSLAGRMETIHLHPLSQVEIERAAPQFLQQLSAGTFPVRPMHRLGNELITRVHRGGFPAAVQRHSERRRHAWLTQYAKALMQKDVRDISTIRNPDVLPRLLEATAGQTARLFNAVRLAAPFALTHQTIRTYLTQLERLFLIQFLPPWHSNRLRRLVKTPKLHVTDSGLASSLLGMNPKRLGSDRQLFGQLLESFVLQELRCQAGWSDEHLHFSHYRDKDKVEVDIVIEQSTAGLYGIEVKASSTISSKDFNGLRRLKNATGSRFRCGVVLYDGETALPFGDRLFAVPISMLWME